MEKAKWRAAIDLIACKKVRIEKKAFDSPEPPFINAVKMTRKDLKTDLKVNSKHKWMNQSLYWELQSTVFATGLVLIKHT